MIAGDRRVVPRPVVTDERVLHVRELSVRLRAVRIDLELRRSTPSRPLRRHLLLEALEVYREPGLPHDLLREFERIAEGVIQEEGFVPRELATPALDLDTLATCSNVLTHDRGRALCGTVE